MIDTAAVCIKLAIAALAVIQMYRGHGQFILLFIIPCFMAGVELIMPTNTPWAYIVSSGISKEEFEKAMMGGILMVAFPIVVFVIFRDGNKPNSKSPQ